MSKCKFKVGDVFKIVKPNEAWDQCFKDLAGKPLVIKRINTRWGWLECDVTKYFGDRFGECAFDIERCDFYDPQLLFDFMRE